MAKAPAYKSIQMDILNRISDGTLKPGERIATEAELMEQYGVSRITAQRAIFELKQRGLLVRKPRAGTFVAQAPSAAPAGGQQGGGLISGKYSIAVVAPFDMAYGGVGGAYQYLKGIMSAHTLGRDQLVLLNTGYMAALEHSMLENCLDRGVSGVIYHPSMYSITPRDTLMRISAYGLPCVQIDQHTPGVPLPCVQTDNMAAARQLTQQALNRGHRRFCFIGDADVQSQSARYLGMCQTLAEAGVPQDCALYRRYDGTNPETLPQLVDWLMKKEVTCACCATDVHAKPLLDACERAGVTNQISIISFDGLYPGLIASMRQDFEQIGRTATELLLQWLLLRQRPEKDALLEAEYVDGTSLKQR